MRRFILLSFALFALISCKKIDNPSYDGNDCVVSLCPVGEISTEESELTKAGANSNSFYAVQVYQKQNQEFAFGIFDDIQSMKLNLKKGFSYSVIICMVKDVKDYIDYYSLTNNGIIGKSNGPFSVRELSGSYYLSNYSYYLKTNTFYYNSNSYYEFYTSSTGTSLSKRNYSAYLPSIKFGYLNSISYPTCSDWFYGEADIVPNGELATLEIPLKRTGFKLKYELTGVTDGSVTVSIGNDTRTFINNTTTTSSFSSETQFIAFYDTYSAWQYADNYTENMTVAVTWVRGIGITQNLGTKTVQIKRNCLNNIKITLGSDDRGAGVSLTAEAESSMGSAENNIPVS